MRRDLAIEVGRVGDCVSSAPSSIAAPQSTGYAPAISGDGHLVGWSSLASNLVTGDGNAAADAFVADQGTGIRIRRPFPLPPFVERQLLVLLRAYG